ncbi:DinB family protein [Actinomadura logoneensis]|uniref:DinB family protein n=1 Tax=Actinomadura logoneensis TaxID=2293572 RepID=A0A372JQB4_9ACTN|nr:DinB family protein [Actinomadura logoneensis]RFU42211.1 DinB family protein [Actinomadura logoneensis]
MAHTSFERVAAVTTSHSERDVLEAFLDHFRETIANSLDGLDEQQARTRLVPSLTTPIGLVGHCTADERSWFQLVVEGRPEAELSGPRSSQDASWLVPDDTSVADVLAAYRTTCAESREIAARFDLDHEFAYEDGRFTLRWIYVHMIEELARHAGHADILREQITSG